jgi:hypothetical protein
LANKNARLPSHRASSALQSGGLLQVPGTKLSRVGKKKLLQLKKINEKHNDNLTIYKKTGVI